MTLTGAGWAASERVHIFVNDDIGQTWQYNGDVTANPDGGFMAQFQLPNSFIATYTVIATGSGGETAQPGSRTRRPMSVPRRAVSASR